jgi:hypothetical protein
MDHVLLSMGLRTSQVSFRWNRCTDKMSSWVFYIYSIFLLIVVPIACRCSGYWCASRIGHEHRSRLITPGPDIPDILVELAGAPNDRIIDAHLEHHDDTIVIAGVIGGFSQVDRARNSAAGFGLDEHPVKLLDD